MDLVRAPRRTARKKGSGYKNGIMQMFSKVVYSEYYLVFDKQLLSFR
jgi:hypothetical protein